ncbi:MAG: DUF6785 family protein [Planctomycetota bacterium]
MTDYQPGLDRREATGSSLTVRGVIIGAVLCGAIGLAGPHWTLYLSLTGLFSDYHGAGPVFCLLAVILVFNLCLGLLARWFRLKAGELRVIAAMTLTAGAIATSGLVAYLVPGMTAPYYHANEANQLHARVCPILEKLPVHRWLFAVDPNGGHIAIEKFWAGIPDGAPIPWQPWVRPLIWWGLFVMALFGVMIAVVSIMRKQWVDHEHLSFPIAQIPAELVSAAARPRHSSTVLHSRAFWLGAGFAVAVGTVRGLSNHYPWLPSLRIQHAVSGLGPMDLRVSVSLLIIGLVFLIPSRVAFSIWSLNLASWILRSFIREYGFGMNEWMLYGVVGHPELQHVSMGALAVFAGGSLWAGRRHLKRVLLCAVGRRPGYDRGEPASYRTALLVVALGSVFCVAWFYLVGMKVHYAVLLLLITVCVYYGLARIIAQCGLPAINSPAVPSTWMASAFGTATLGSEQVVGLGAHLTWHADLRNSPMSGAAHGQYLTGRRSGGLFWAMMIGLLTTYVVASLFTIRLGYHHGASTMHPWYVNLSSSLTWRWTSSMAQATEGPNWAGVTWTGVGAAAMVLLIVAQRLFFWWPFHPVGFLTSGTFLVTVFWFSVFLSWLIKVTVVYVGGGRAYRMARRLFIGAVLGTFAIGGMWAVIDGFVGSGGGVFSL